MYNPRWEIRAFFILFEISPSLQIDILIMSKVIIVLLNLQARDRNK